VPYRPRLDNRLIPLPPSSDRPRPRINYNNTALAVSLSLPVCECQFATARSASRVNFLQAHSPPVSIKPNRLCCRCFGNRGDWTPPSSGENYDRSCETREGDIDKDTGDFSGFSISGVRARSTADEKLYI